MPRIAAHDCGVEDEASFVTMTAVELLVKVQCSGREEVHCRGSRAC